MRIKIRTSEVNDDTLRTEAAIDKKIVGSAFAHIEEGGKIAETYNLQVNQKERRQGIGRQLKEEQERELKARGVNQTWSELPQTTEEEVARKFHESRGTNIAGRLLRRKL